jgi:hypothetical protein
MMRLQIKEGPQMKISFKQILLSSKSSSSSLRKKIQCFSIFITSNGKKIKNNNTIKFKNYFASLRGH